MALSAAARLAAYARESDAVWHLCVTIAHPSLNPPIRVTDNNENVARIVGGQEVEFIAFPFEIALPSDDPEHQGRVQVKIHDQEIDFLDGTRGTITSKIRGLRPAPTLTMEVVTSKDPDTVERGPFAMTLRDRDSTDGQIVCDFAFEDILDDAHPGDYYTAANAPGLFA